MALTDPYGRTIRKLRVSLLDLCNFRCLYCMPKQHVFQKKTWLNPSQITVICLELMKRGVDEIRLTGGEPCLRREFQEIVAKVADLSPKKFGLTTNGFFLSEHLNFLKEKNCTHINISLDSLKPDVFKEISKKDGLSQVLKTIGAAKDKGFHVKINTVLLRGKNDNEIENFLEFSKNFALEVRFLELMKIGYAQKKHQELFISAQEIIDKIRENFIMTPEITSSDSTSFNYKLCNGARIGFIASESKPFCGTCSRWRLSCDGKLRACLMSEQGIDLAMILAEDMDEALAKLLPMKPYRRAQSVLSQMNEIGG